MSPDEISLCVDHAPTKICVNIAVSSIGVPVIRILYFVGGVSFSSDVKLLIEEKIQSVYKSRIQIYFIFSRHNQLFLVTFLFLVLTAKCRGRGTGSDHPRYSP